MNILCGLVKLSIHFAWGKRSTSVEMSPDLLTTVPRAKIEKG